MARTAAFTLIELMIAIALASLLMYTAFMGVRTTAQAMTQTNRLATENALVTAGYLRALDEIDTWTAYDDPDDTSKTWMRGNGMPFSPFNASFLPASSSGSNAETDRGWDADYQWPASDARTWWNGNQAERCVDTNDLRMGAYNQFGCTTAVTARTHTWLYNQMNGLKNALGYQGLCEYLPANSLYAYHVPTANGTVSNKTNPDGLLNELSRPGWFNNGDGNTSFPIGIFRLTKDTSFAIPPLFPVGGTVPVLANYAQRWSTGYVSSTSSVNGFLSLNLSRAPLLGGNRGPPTWPSVQVGVARYTTYNRFVCLCKVTWTDPLSGQAHELSFTGFGTTLRGARQQRRRGLPGASPAPGWAVWHAKGDTANDPTLDTY
jgi:prepilin-type N-terminal cleavage/methylation domain-containing protein